MLIISLKDALKTVLYQYISNTHFLV